MTATNMVAILSPLVALVGAYFGFSNSRFANRNSQAELQQAFTKQVMEDVDRIKAEAREARDESRQAKADMGDLQRQHDVLRREMAAMQDWVDRVTRARDAYMADHPDALTEPEDSGVFRILRAINGGPHTTV